MKMSKNKRSKILWTCLAAFWVLLIWANSLTPGQGSSKLSDAVVKMVESVFSAIGIRLEIPALFIRKMAHFIEYLVLGILAYNAMGRYEHTTLKRQCIYSCIFVILIAIIDESIQYFVPGRAAHMLDVLLDTVGGATGILCMAFVLQHRRRKGIKTEMQN